MKEGLGLLAVSVYSGHTTHTYMAHWGCHVSSWLETIKKSRFLVTYDAKIKISQNSSLQLLSCWCSKPLAKIQIMWNNLLIMTIKTIQKDNLVFLILSNKDKLSHSAAWHIACFEIVSFRFYIVSNIFWFWQTVPRWLSLILPPSWLYTTVHACNCWDYDCSHKGRDREKPTWQFLQLFVLPTDIYRAHVNQQSSGGRQNVV